MQSQIPIVFRVRGVECTIIPHLFSITLTPKKKKKHYKKALEEQQDPHEHPVNTIQLNLRDYYGNYDINEYKEIYGVLSQSITDVIRSVSGVNQRFSTNKLLNDIAKDNDQIIDNIAPLFQKTKVKHKKVIDNLAVLLLTKDQEPEPVINKGNYLNRIVPISILPILFDKIANFLGPGRIDNTLFVSEIFDKFNIDYIRSQINDYHIDESMVATQIDVMNQNNNILKRLYQRQAFKYYAYIRRTQKKLLKKEDKTTTKKRKRNSDKDNKKHKKRKITRENDEKSEDLLADL
jgi:hypothetical protein